MPLSQFCVLEIGDLPAASYCARLLSDLGAAVIRLRGPEALAPSPDTLDGAWSGFLHFGKSCTPFDAAALPGLLAGADVCIDSRPPAARIGCDPRVLAPGLLHLDVGWFGRSGPYAGFAGGDAVCRALAGLVQLVGPAAGPPLAHPDHQAAIIGGLSGAIAVLGCLLGQQDGEAGRAVELSVHEACIALAEYQASEARIAGWPDARLGVNRFTPTFPLGIYPARDGWVGVTLITPAQWRGFCLLLGLDAWADAPDLMLGADRLPCADELEAAFVPRLRERTAAEWFQLGLRHRLPLVAVPDLPAVLAHPPFRERGAVVPIRFGDRVAYGPGAPLGLTRTPARRGGTVPEDTVPKNGAAHPPRPAPARPTRPAEGLPLRGLRVIDLTMGWAGPLATRHLADLGADVVKVEACGYPDWWRGVDTRPDAAAGLRHERTGRFVVMNRNKRGITLDLAVPEGAAILRRLAAGADAVVENYSPGVLPKLGLSYDELRADNPSLVMASMSAFGAGGPWSECRAYGSTLEHASGLPHLVGEPGGPPTMGHLAFGDAIGGLNAAVAVLAALLHRRRTGKGQHINLSQVECMLPFTAAAMILHSATGETPARTSSRHHAHAPHNVFRCRGEDAWVLASVTDDAAWLGLCAAIGRPDLRADPTLRAAAGRRARAAELEAAVAAWTAGRSPAEAMAALQAHGVAAGAVLSPNALHEDPHLVARGFWQWRDRAAVGRHPLPSLAFRDGPAPYPVRWPAPTLGQHTTEVLTELLGLMPSDLAGLAERGVTGTQPILSRRRAPPVPA